LGIPNTDQDHWTFPVGTKFWKEFSFPKVGSTTKEFKRVETRLLEKVSDNQWEFSAYVWNEEETEATLAPTLGIRDVYPTGPDTKHDIPSVAQCLTCHRRGGDVILGFDSLQLSDDRDPLAPGSFALEYNAITLSTLTKEGLLSQTPFDSHPKIHATTPEGRAALGYFHAICGNCHNPKGVASWTGLILRHTSQATTPETETGFATAVNQLTKIFQIPGQDETYRIKSGDPDSSAILYRMNDLGFQRMPPVGTKRLHEQAVDLISQWVSNL